MKLLTTTILATILTLTGITTTTAATPRNVTYYGQIIPANFDNCHLQAEAVRWPDSQLTIRGSYWGCQYDAFYPTPHYKISVYYMDVITGRVRQATSALSGNTTTTAYGNQVEMTFPCTPGHPYFIDTIVKRWAGGTGYVTYSPVASLYTYCADGGAGIY